MHKIKNKGTTVIVKRLGDLILRVVAPRRRAAVPALRLDVAAGAAVVVLFRVCFAIIFKFSELTELAELK